MVLPRQNSDIPIKKNRPNGVDASSFGNIKQTAATKTKK